MVDPLDILSTPVVAVPPDPEFTAALRQRLQRALHLPEGVVMTDLANLDLALETTAPADSGSFPRPGALPYLAVRGARAAIDFYVTAFGARQLGEPVVMPDGRIGHCELQLGGGVIYLAEEHPELGLMAPPAGSVSVSLMLAVPDADATLDRARAAGATVQRAPANNHGRRGATLIDPFGHRWMLSAPLTAGGGEPIRHGDIGYVSWWTPDAGRAARFYNAVLGWELGPHGQVGNLSRQIGIDGEHERSTLFCCYAVDDIAEAVHTIRDAGGSAEDPTTEPYGPVSFCAEPAGTPFAVYQPNPDDPRPTINGTQPGDITYVTFRPSGSSASVREFYGAVLGWQFTPGHVADGWEPVGVHPMAGLAGGGDGTTVPMWKVSDVPAAVQRVRDAGGAVLSDPAQQPYGISAECLDDQGGHFYLGDT
ncbi:MAG: VOC family protein [Actinomycetota bacterium]|nr:VOC family protein [Actinomycetota bacterium]